ncbi:poxvirus late transcription factor VLTF3-like protein [Tupanvirus soda lake]|uniref:Poxvirus late transcription factor VLTF3-like protein n=2 Tax=Tupanvirus TaxID=2094720 RepID=A0A6N1NV32_9VIRU|nr:poxvirus late transcription factor VLTF3-like protein [Tupanvirus soda lake]QKU35346.1 poxvirus late transcription factor VLTF3-like protein [Tupanvirus soda lake]
MTKLLEYLQYFYRFLWHIIIVTINRIKYKLMLSLYDFFNRRPLVYSRSHHFIHFLYEIQGIHYLSDTYDVFNEIFEFLNKHNIDKNKLNLSYLKYVLRELNYRKYYEDASQILYIINGTKPPSFGIINEFKMIRMFDAIQTPFKMFRPSTRINFLNYSYVVFKFCGILGLQSETKFMSLRGTEKIIENDKIWKKICKYKKWKYQPTIEISNNLKIDISND